VIESAITPFENVAKSNMMTYTENVTNSNGVIAMARRGGARPGAGRKSRWGVPTVTIRVPVTLRDEIERFVEERIAQSETATESKQERQLPTVTENVTESKPRSHRRRSETATKPKLQPRIPLEIYSNGQCQVSTKSGHRCRGRVSSYLNTVLSDGREVSIAVCAIHSRSPVVQVHPSVEIVAESDCAT